MAEQETCPRSTRVDGPFHSWKFDGDDPYIVCAFCHEMRDALSGRVIRAGLPGPDQPNAPCHTGHAATVCAACADQQTRKATP